MGRKKYYYVVYLFVTPSISYAYCLVLDDEVSLTEACKLVISRVAECTGVYLVFDTVRKATYKEMRNCVNIIDMSTYGKIK